MCQNHSMETTLHKRRICYKLFEEQCSSLMLSLPESRSMESITRENIVLQKKLDDLEESHKSVLLISGSSDDSK